MTTNEKAANPIQKTKPALSKKTILGGPQAAIFVPSKGCTDILEAELSAAVASRRERGKFEPEIHVEHGSVRIENVDFRTLLELTARVRCAADVRWIVLSAKATSLSPLKNKLSNVPWTDIVPANSVVESHANSVHSRLYHETMLAEFCDKTIQAKLKIDKNAESSKLCVFLSFVKDRFSLQVSMRGDPPFSRRYLDTRAATASMRAPLAASMINWMLRQHSEQDESCDVAAIHNPFAGSGTLGMEATGAILQAAHIQLDRAPACWNWPLAPASTVSFLQKHLQSQNASDKNVSLRISEWHDRIWQGLQKNTKAFSDMFPQVTVSSAQEDFFKSTEKLKKDCWNIFVINPPFGDRLGQNISDLGKFYKRIGERLSAIASPRFSAFVLCPDEDRVKDLRSGFSAGFIQKSRTFNLGGKTVTGVLLIAR
jgi:23S rRNA G2445 N2-methylase RlmL